MRTVNYCICGKIIDYRSKNCRSCAVRILNSKRDPSVNEKIRATLIRKGLKPPITHRTDEQNPAWRGGGYDYIHDWIVRVAGVPDTCEHCGVKSNSRRKIQWANIGHKYRRVRGDWKRLCASCHKLCDLGKLILITKNE